MHRLVLVNKTGAAQSEIRIGEVGLARNTPDYHPLIVLNMILGGQFVSRINMKLRQEKGLTYGARTAFDFRRGRGPFILQTSVQSDGTGRGDSRRRCWKFTRFGPIGRRRPTRSRSRRPR